MSFHELNVPAHRRHPRPDGLLVQRAERDHGGSVDAVSRTGSSAGVNLSGLSAHGPTPVDAATPDTGVPARPARLVVDDTVTEPQPGQLRKTDFLDQLQGTVRAEVDAALAGTGRTSADCPYLDHWFTYYRGQSGDHVENAVRRYAPATRAATTAAAYIPLVAQQVRQGVERWASTGDLSGIPEGMAGGMSGPVSLLGGALFAARESGAHPSDDPATVSARLGQGRPLDSGVRSRMESAFGRSFDGVRTHTDATGSQLSAQQNAKAFTVGEHIAFGTGEYRPGTMVGDALIAHELAHVAQQQVHPSTSTPSNTSRATLEHEADRATVGAVAALWSGARVGSPPARTRAGTAPRLQRCASSPRATTSPQVPRQAPATVPTSGGLDARAQAVIAIGRNTAVSAEERAIQVVRTIIREYFPEYVNKVSAVRYEANSPGLETGPARPGPNIPRFLVVGDYFLNQTTERHFARRVLQVRHELQHVDQLNEGMSDKNEREFLAHHRGALSQELPGTGRMQHSTRVNLIDAALAYYNLLSADKQERYRAQRDELVARRSVEVRASGGTRPASPAGDSTP